MTIKSAPINKTFDMPNIFHAAEFNDTVELAEALAEGQRLDDRHPHLLDMTPMHIACVKSSNAFIEAAAKHESCNPWLRDGNLRVAFDHAAARNNRQAMYVLFCKMYPEQAGSISPPTI